MVYVAAHRHVSTEITTTGGVPTPNTRGTDQLNSSSALYPAYQPLILLHPKLTRPAPAHSPIPGDIEYKEERVQKRRKSASFRKL